MRKEEEQGRRTSGHGLLDHGEAGVLLELGAVAIALVPGEQTVLREQPIAVARRAKRET